MSDNKKGKEDLFIEYILFGIFCGLFVFLLMKILFGPKQPVDLVLVLIITVGAGIVFVGLGSFLISRRSVRNEILNFKADIVNYLQSKKILPEGYKIDKKTDIVTTKNKIITFYKDLIEKISEAQNRSRQLEEALGKYTDIRGGNIDSVFTQKCEKREVTVLFADIRGYFSFSEKMRPEDIVKFMNYYFTVVSRIIHKNGGLVNKFIGDAVMAVFEPGTREETDLYPIKAVAAAFEIHKMFTNVIKDSGVFVAEPVQMGIGVGINTGYAIVGPMGSQERTEYSILGEPVNIAAILSKKAGYGMTLVGSGTFEKVKGKVDAVELEPIALKGKQTLQKTYLIKEINLIER